MIPKKDLHFLNCFISGICDRYRRLAITEVYKVSKAKDQLFAERLLCAEHWTGSRALPCSSPSPHLLPQSRSTACFVRHQETTSSMIFRALNAKIVLPMNFQRCVALPRISNHQGPQSKVVWLLAIGRSSLIPQGYNIVRACPELL